MDGHILCERHHGNQIRLDMFDPQTRILIQRVPELPELDRDRLPEELTRAFAAIVAFRLSLANSEEALSDELKAKLAEFRRMAATFETMVALIPSRDDRSSAAFVAAQAYHVLHLAQAIHEPNRRIRPLCADSIAPEVSALLLFLIANQIPDATEMAREIDKLRKPERGSASLVTDALCALAEGRVRDIPQLLTHQVEWPHDSSDAATEALYRRVLQGLSLFAQYVLDSQLFPEAAAHAVDAFKQVQNLSLESENWPVISGHDSPLPSLSAFAGPHHLASLLIGATGYLKGAALSVVPPPNGVPPGRWQELIKPIAAQRPFLWPNHLEALEKGFLHTGTSSVVSFPTGAGKTTLSVLKAASALGLGGAVIYLAPTHALVAQTKSDLSRAFPGVPVRDSLLIEDFYAEIGEEFVTNNSQIVVMTPERCLALLSLERASFGVVRLVVFDECHLIHPRSGGQNRRSLDAMFALLQLHSTAPNCDWLLLSAMMANGVELAGWMESLTGRPCLALTLNWKPTRQARGCLVYKQDDLDNLRVFLRQRAVAAPRNGKGMLGNPTSLILSDVSAVPYGFIGLQQTWQNREVRNYTLLRLLNEPVPLSATLSTGNEPTWYTTPNKNVVASHLASQCVRIGLKVLLFSQSPRDTTAISRKIDELIGDDCNPLIYEDEETLLLKIAIDEAGSVDAVIAPTQCSGSHNAALLPSERSLVERLFARADGVRALAATATLAQGMNLPADVVVIVGDERFDADAEGFAPLDPHELLNAAGRAGRAGLVAQGLVIVIPHTLVGVNPQTNTIGEKWTQMQESVFSQADQCLSLQDPIQHILDKIQEVTAGSDPDVRYFLRRLPRGMIGSPDDASRFLRSTLAAWHAKTKHEEAKFEALISRTLSRRNELEPVVLAETWRDEMAYRTGIAVEFIEALHLELLTKTANPPADTEGWVRWFFVWLATDERWVKSVFGHRLSERQQKELFGGDLFGGRLADAVWGWMSGETLTSLNIRLGGNATKPGKCDKARKFVLKMIPDLAFAAGLATRIRRGQIDETGGSMPITLATLALCIREGLANPELAALRTTLGSTAMSRIALRTLWAKLSAFAPPMTSDEKFGRTRLRISQALEIAQSWGAI